LQDDAFGQRRWTANPRRGIVSGQLSALIGLASSRLSQVLMSVVGQSRPVRHLCGMRARWQAPRSNPLSPRVWKDGLLRFARNDGGAIRGPTDPYWLRPRSL